MHIYTALAWLVVLALVVVVGDRRGVSRTLHELDTFDADDRRWLSGRRARKPGRPESLLRGLASAPASVARSFVPTEP